MVRWADIWGLERTVAVKATGSSAITGSATALCPVDTLWQDASEVVYVQDANVTTDGAGNGTIAVTAQVAAAAGNQSAGATLSLVSPVAGIDTDSTVDGSGLTGGLDQETLVALLARLLLRLRTPPSGGGPGDYIAWALEIAGATRAWQIANGDGAGTVAIYFVQDDDSVTIIPDASEITTMQTHIDSKAPVTADANVYAPTEVALVITAAIVPNTAAVKTAAEAEINDLILRVGDPSQATTLLLSQIDEAMSLAAGETDHTISLIDGGAPADVVYAIGQLPKLTTPITWT